MVVIPEYGAEPVIDRYPADQEWLGTVARSAFHLHRSPRCRPEYRIVPRRGVQCGFPFRQNFRMACAAGAGGRNFREDGRVDCRRRQGAGVREVGMAVLARCRKAAELLAPVACGPFRCLKFPEQFEDLFRPPIQPPILALILVGRQPRNLLEVDPDLAQSGADLVVFDRIPGGALEIEEELLVGSHKAVESLVVSALLQMMRLAGSQKEQMDQPEEFQGEPLPRIYSHTHLIIRR